jgi:DNA-binding GntR family transcriptional regulator
MTINTTPRLVRTKTSAAVVDYIVEQLFDGQLQSGNRIDLDQVGVTLGVSRLPVREAMVVLERDGIVASRYHRGYYVETFDADSILDDFEIMGLLSGMAVRRLAHTKDADTIENLNGLLDELRSLDPSDTRNTAALVNQIMIIEHRAGGSRRLRAELRSRTGFIPHAFRLISDRKHADTVRSHERVLRAIIAGDGEKAAHYRLEDLRDAGKRVVRELQRRHVIGDP